eukprot:scaffold273796_cov31-Tisochrysis_lutea.AAC.10
MTAGCVQSGCGRNVCWHCCKCGADWSCHTAWTGNTNAPVVGAVDSVEIHTYTGCGWARATCIALPTCNDWP